MKLNVFEKTIRFSNVKYGGDGAKTQFICGYPLFDLKELETYVYHVSEYLNLANKNGFELVELKELFDEENRIGIPRLIGITLRKTTVGN